MASRICAALTFVVLVGFCVATPRAHHAVSGAYDLSKINTLKGVISKVDWINPHANIHVEVDAKGAKESWRLETLPPGQLQRAGVSKQTLMGEPGEVVTVTYLPARDGTPHIGYLQRITHADGRFTQLGSNEQETLRKQGER